MPRKIRDLLDAYRQAGCRIDYRGGKGSHRKIMHARHPGILILSGNPGDDAKRYQEADLKKFLEEIQQ